jgi:ectoine hydroxylase-related dioxygenase (phytanoyl-CoA dioxygenase family)
VGEQPWSLADRYRDDERYRRATEAERSLIDAFHRDGVAELRGAVPADLVARVVEWDARRRRSPAEKVADAWRTSGAVRSLACAPAVIEAVELLHGRRAIPFQTLNFRTGSEQAFHADSVHFDSLPGGWMCGVWVALEAIGPGQGPVRYVVGTHRAPGGPGDRFGPPGTPYSDYEARVAAEVASLPVRSFHAEPGDALVWAARVVHGGAVVTEPGSTRRSQVTHYFFEGTGHVTPMASDLAGGRIRLRDGIVDLRTGRHVRPEPPGMDVVRVGRHDAVVLAPGSARPPALVRLRGRLWGAVAAGSALARRVAAHPRRRAA